MDHLYFAAALLALLALFIAIFVWLFRRAWTQESAVRALFLRAVISVSMLLGMFALVETYFAGFYVNSDGYGTTLAGSRWFQLYWNPINELGYRDRNHTWGDDLSLIHILRCRRTYEWCHCCCWRHCHT